MPKSKPKSEPMASMRDIDDDHLNLPSMLESNSGVHELFEHLPDASELVHDSGIPQASRKKVPRQTFALSIRTIATNKHQQSDEADKAAITSKVAEPADNTSATKPITLGETKKALDHDVCSLLTMNK